MRLERLHSFNPARTTDLASNHAIRHTVLSLYLFCVFLVNISHNAGALNRRQGHTKTQRGDKLRLTKHMAL